jgi:hypothetical protein
MPPDVCRPAQRTLLLDFVDDKLAEIGREIALGLPPCVTWRGKTEVTMRPMRAMPCMFGGQEFSAMGKVSP